MQNMEETIIVNNNVKDSGAISRREFLKATGFLVGGLAIGSAAFLPDAVFLQHLRLMVMLTR